MPREYGTALISFLPRVRRFSDRPRRDAVRLILYWDNVHLFVFHWGCTLRWREERNHWRHTTAFARVREGDGKGFYASMGTWLTENGTQDRVPLSKRYVVIKGLLG